MVGPSVTLDWLDVIVDRPERLLTVLLQVATPAGPQLQAYAARPEGVDVASDRARLRDSATLAGGVSRVGRGAVDGTMAAGMADLV